MRRALARRPNSAILTTASVRRSRAERSTSPYRRVDQNSVRSRRASSPSIRAVEAAIA